MLAGASNTARLDSRIEFVLRKMEDGDDCPNLEELASSLDMSKSYLRHLFKQEVGMPPNRYIKLVRLNKLRALLTYSLIQVKQAIVVSGLSDFSHTVRDYKLLYGQTPSQTKRARQCGKQPTESQFRQQNSHSGQQK